MRFLLAFDDKAKDKKVYFRATSCVTHDGNIGEVIYHAKPKSLTARRIRKAIKLLEQILEGGK